MQENQGSCTDAKHNARNSIATERRSHFVESSSHRPASRHPNRPSVFHGSYIGSDQPPIIASHLLEPFAHRFISWRGFEEGCRNLFLVIQVTLYQNKYRWASVGRARGLSGLWL